jgi:hypothetical protein
LWKDNPLGTLVAHAKSGEARMQKWFGHTVRLNKEELLPPRDYKGFVEYIVVSSRIDTHDGILFPGNKKKEAFPWIKVMDRNDLRSFSP